MKRLIVAVAALFAYTGFANTQPTGYPQLSLPHAPRVAWLGDSVLSNGIGISPVLVQEVNHGVVTWAKMLTNYRIHSPYTFNVSIPGDLTAQVLALVPDALAVKPDICVVSAGRADAMSSFPILPEDRVGSATYNLNQIYNQLQAANCIVVALKNISTPFAAWNPGTEVLDLQINNWIENQKRVRKGFYVIDFGNSYDDQTSTVHWQPKTNYVGADGVHPGPWGAYVLGNKIASLFNQIYPDWRLRIQNVDDVYDPVNNPTGNLMTNQMFTGTGGSLTNGATGTVATGCTLDGQVLNGSAVAGTKATTTDGRVAQRITVSGTVNGATNGKVQLFCPLTITGVNQGDTIQCSIDANWGATTNIGGVALQLQTNEGNNLVFLSQIGNSLSLTGTVESTLPTETQGGGGPAGTSLTIPMYTPARTLSGPLVSGFVKIQITYLFALANASAVAGTFNFASPSCRKLTPETAQ